MGFTDHRSCGSFLPFLLLPTAERSFLCYNTGFASSRNIRNLPIFDLSTFQKFTKQGDYENAHTY